MALIDWDLAVIDVETTGVFPKTDRVVEVAVLRLGSDGAILSEYCTLVNPQRDVGPTEIHGITATDILDAPRFQDIAGDVLSQLRDAIVVGHNVRFDLTFVRAELARDGVDLPQVASLCTLAMSRRLALSLPKRKLAICCDSAGIETTGIHTALGDAKATAQLVLHYLKLAQKQGLHSAVDIGCENHDRTDGQWPTCRASGRVHLRGASRRPDDDGSYVRRLLERLEAPADSSAQAEYLDVLERALEDRRVTAEEARSLYEVARMFRLSGEEVRATHRNYLRAVADAAVADGVVSEAERTDLAHVTALLGLEATDLDTVMAQALSAQQSAKAIGAKAEPQVDKSVAGKSVCFTGSLSARFRGERIKRETAEAIANAAGLRVEERVTTTLNILVVADPNSLSSKARRARDYGTRIIAEMEFWRLLGVQTD